MNNYVVGNVFSIDGLRITVIMRQNTNMLSYFYNGETYRGVSIGEYVGILRGPYKIVARVEKEYLQDKLHDESNQTYSLNRFERRIEVSAIGYFHNGFFRFGVKSLPMIFNEVVLLNENEIANIVGYRTSSSQDEVTIHLGASLQENIQINVPVEGLFNSHIGVFGNTGSGKSNTLTKMFTELFGHKALDITRKSKFVVLDFNGEYTGTNVFCEQSEKKVIKLSTRGETGDKLKLSAENFWNKTTLSILFSATEKTQQPFIQNMLEYYLSDDDVGTEQLRQGIVQGYRHVFEGNNNRESLNLFRKVIQIATKAQENFDYSQIPYYDYQWHTQGHSYYNPKNNNDFLNNDQNVKENIDRFQNIVNDNFTNLNELPIVDKILILAHLQLIYGLRYNHVQYEHISPLLARIESSRSFIEKTIEIGEDNNKKFLTIISMKDCNQDAKRTLPLLLAKQLYDEHIKISNQDGTIVKTCHLIIDEAHNILSEQSTREAVSFKDYRLEVFEQIVKEGRKYGFYLTISSQRPYDISPTIISQLHNYFIHRLVNDMDLSMIANTISSLDAVAKGKIPNLAPGQCVLTGTLFALPLMIQVQKLQEEQSPNSENAHLLELWSPDLAKDFGD